MTLSLRPTRAVSERVLHALAAIDAGAHPANLYDPRYLAWARGRYPRESLALIDEDAPRWAQRLAPSTLVAWHGLPAAFDGIDALLAWARDPDGSHGAIVAHCAALDRECAEWLALDLAFEARSFERAFVDRVEPALRTACERVRPWVERACEVHPALADKRIELSAALGVHGRALGARTLFAGAPGLWSAHDEARVAVQLLHESFVQEQRSLDYVCAEWFALVALARAAAETGFEAPHARWAAEHELRSLGERALARGYLERAQFDAIAWGTIDQARGLRECPLR